MPKHLKEDRTQEFRLNIAVEPILCTQYRLDQAIAGVEQSFPDNASPEEITALAKRVIVLEDHSELIKAEIEEVNKGSVRPHDLSAKIAAALAAKVKIDTN